MRTEELRIAKTESRFRDVNERIAQSAEKIGAESTEFVCECADSECGRRIEATLDEYRRIRADGAHFLIAPEHEEAEHELVLDSGPGYRIIQKLEAVGALARRLSPRPAR